MDKIALIYEFNKNSPLFVKVAADELEKKNIDRAIKILEDGIQLYPDYPTASIMYARALAMVGEFDDAELMLRKGCELINSEETYNFYLKQFSELKEKDEQITESRRATFVPENLDEIDETTEGNSSEEEAVPQPEKQLPIEENLEQLAEELDNAKMPEPEPIVVNEEILEDPEPEPEPEKLEKEIVSETLAGIYFAQGNLEEALGIYEKLIEYQPEKADFFNKRVIEIKELLENGETF